MKLSKAALMELVNEVVKDATDGWWGDAAEKKEEAAE